MSIYRGRSLKEFSLASTLYDAIKDNDYKGALVLLRKGADPNLVLSCGISSFHLIIGDDSKDFAFKVTKLILQYGGNPNVQTDEGLTPLHIAAAWGRADLVKLLLNCGANPEVRDSNGLIPIYYAIEYQHPDSIILLRNSMYNDVINPNEQENDIYDFILDKIVINNGYAEAEYEVGSEKQDSLAMHNLQKLPQTTPSDYVRDWCCTHAMATQQQNKPKKEDKSTEAKEKSFDSCNFSQDSNKGSAPNLAFINCNRRKVNKNVIENFSLSYEPSIKYKMRRSTLNKKMENTDESNMSHSISKQSEASQESGILTLPGTSFRDENSHNHPINNLSIDGIVWNELSSKSNETNRLSNAIKDTTSDYFTSNEFSGSTNIMEQNMFDLTSSSVHAKNNITKCSSHGLSFDHDIIQANDTIAIPDIRPEDGGGGGGDEETKDTTLLSIAEVYKYTDNKEGIILYEKRLLVNTKNDETESNLSIIKSQSSKLSSLPATFDYDTDSLRNELIQCGYHPGPITKTTKRVYLKKLSHLQRHVQPKVNVAPIDLNDNKVYSMEVEETFKNPNWMNNLTEYKSFEEIICKDFTNSDPSRKWREGINKSSFTYLLLDPRITKNLPSRAEKLSSEEIWRTFLSSIFYVGKGKRNRPYSHLYEAVTLWRQNSNENLNKKLQHIINIWNDKHGVVCLHVFQNVIPVEAYTREAAMINALRIANIKNLKAGDFYGTASAWSSKQQNMLGVLLLYKAMLIFLNEGERQLCPADIN